MPRKNKTQDYEARNAELEAEVARLRNELRLTGARDREAQEVSGLPSPDTMKDIEEALHAELIKLRHGKEVLDMTVPEFNEFLARLMDRYQSMESICKFWGDQLDAEHARVLPGQGEENGEQEPADEKVQNAHPAAHEKQQAFDYKLAIQAHMGSMTEEGLKKSMLWIALMWAERKNHKTYDEALAIKAVDDGLEIMHTFRDLNFDEVFDAWFNTGKMNENINKKELCSRLQVIRASREKVLANMEDLCQVKKGDYRHIALIQKLTAKEDRMGAFERQITKLTQSLEDSKTECAEIKPKINELEEVKKEVAVKSQTGLKDKEIARIETQIRASTRQLDKAKADLQTARVQNEKQEAIHLTFAPSIERGMKVLNRALVRLAFFWDIPKDQLAVDIGNDAAHSIDVMGLIAAFRHGYIEDSLKDLFENIYGFSADNYLSSEGERLEEELRNSPTLVNLLNMKGAMANCGSFTRRTLDHEEDDKFEVLFCECKDLLEDETPEDLAKTNNIETKMTELREIVERVDALYQTKRKEAEAAAKEHRRTTSCR